MIYAGKFNKRTFKSFVESPCLRKLYLNLGNARVGWTYADGMQVALEDQTHSQAQTVVVYGKIFEDEYLYNLQQKEPQYILDCTPSYIDDDPWPLLAKRQEKERENWILIQQKTRENGFVFAFELMWAPEDSFVQSMVGTEYVSLLEYSRGDRPDTLLFEQENGSGSYFLLNEDDTIEEETCQYKGISVTVLDIKNTPIERCEKHFSDVVYYITSLLHRIRALGLSNQIRVRTKGNGILGRLELEELQSLSPSTLKAMIRGAGTPNGHISVDWSLYSSLGISFHHGLASVMKDQKCFEHVKPIISKSCRYCSYAHRCLNGSLDTRQRLHKEPHVGDSIATLPEMKSQIQQALEKEGIQTIANLIERTPELKEKNLNQHVCEEYAPYLRKHFFQALAIQEGKVLDQNERVYQQLWKPGAYTTNLPYEEEKLVFLDVESDPAQKRLVALSFLYGTIRKTYVNRSVQIEDERVLLVDFCTFISSSIPDLCTQGFAFWGGVQKLNFSEALARHLDLEGQFPILFRIFSTETSFSNPLMQSKIYDLEQAVHVLFAFPSRFSLSWHEAHRHLCTDVLAIEKECWGEGKNFFDFSLWNLFAGEAKGYHSTSSFSKEDEDVVITAELQEIFARHGIVRDQRNGWIGNAALHDLIASEMQKKMTALYAITKECYQRAQEFIFQDPLYIPKNKRFLVPEHPQTGSRISQLLWDYEMMERWSKFCDMRRPILFPHEHVMKQASIWIRPPRTPDREYQLPQISQEVLSASDLGSWIFVLNKNDYRIKKGKWNRVEHTSKGMAPERARYTAPEGMLAELYRDNWLQSCTALLTRLLNQSELSQNMPIEPQEEWGKKPFSRSPSTAELYFLCAAFLREKGVLSIEEKLYTKVSPPPSEDQRNAIFSFLRYPIALIQGPPGTGKSSTIIAMLDEWLVRRGPQKNARILITAANYAAMTVVVQKIAATESLHDIPIRLVNYTKRENISSFQDKSVFVDLSKDKWKCRRWDGEDFVVCTEEVSPERCIFVANDYSLGKVFRNHAMLPSFDLVVLDEASQLSPDHFLASLAFVHPLDVSISGRKIQILTPKEEWTKVLIVGDGDQLSAVRTVTPPDRYAHLLRSTYSFYEHQLSRSNQQTIQLTQNFRSVPPIIKSINTLGIYSQALLSFSLLKKVPDWLMRTRFFSEKRYFSVGFLIHGSRRDVQRSPTEISLCVQAVLNLWKEKPVELSLRDFFIIHVGIVTPHNAQRIALGDALMEALFDVLSTEEATRHEEEQVIRGAIRTVDKFQGSDRSVIIASMGVSSPSRLQEEEEFLYQLNRFNVTISRPKYRLLFVCSETFLLHIPKKEGSIAMVKGIRAIMKKICVRKISFAAGALECTLHHSVE